MRAQHKALILGAALAASLGALSPADAAAGPGAGAPLTVGTSMFACSGAVCSPGLGNVGLGFEASPVATGGPAYSGPESSPYLWTLVSGSLPAGVALDGGVLYGTPTKAGTSSFTLKVTDIVDGESAEQAYSITVGTGALDRVVIEEASYAVKGEKTSVYALDANTGATLTVYVTATGQKLGTLTNFGAGSGSGLFEGTNLSQGTHSVTVDSSLGGSSTLVLTVEKGSY
ncbi:MAG TPA: Ig domain-containing protein [Actinocrinis sp.]|nr:Ig domain-containing protein [Actinocrinis sp.]